VRPTLLLLPVCLLLACPAQELPEPEYWPGDDVRPELEAGYFGDYFDQSDLSLYAGMVSGPVEERPDHQRRGAFAFGNGRAFSLIGLTDPLNTLHSPVGPVYDKGSRFFGDVALRLELDGQEVDFEEERIARVRGAGVIVTRADAAEATLYTVDFAPQFPDGDSWDVPPALVRIAVVEVHAGSHDVVLRVDPRRAPQELEGQLVEVVSADPRYMGYLPWTGAEGLTLEGETIAIPMGSLTAGASAEATLVLGTAHAVADLDPIEAEMAASSPEQWLEETLAWWSEFSARGLQLDLPDPRIVDLYDGMRVGIRVQQSAAGATCPMSQYTLVWLRDNIGPMRFFLRAGLHEEARASLDYLHLCARERGDYSNACDSGLSPDDVVDEPDWDALGTFSGRLAAEGPSYVPLMYAKYAEWTGDTQLVADRWPYLRRGLTGQQMDDQGLQPFSGDETFRTAMSAAFGYDLAYMYEDHAWSANSSFLMAAAAGWMGEMAPELGESGDVQLFADLEGRARTALSDHFALPQGHYAPFILHEEGFTEERPFEDVNLKALWTGALEPGDPTALSNLQGLRDAAGRGDGTVQSQIDGQYGEIIGYVVREGVNTGMVPGYYLWNLAAIGDPESEAAFDALHDYADPAGQYAEYMVYDDMTALSPIYDATGAIGDYTARHRPWEGGIDIDAMLYWLLGAEPRAGGGLTLKPRLPNGLRWMDAGPVRAGGAAGRLRLERTEEALIATFVSEAEEPFELVMSLPIPEGWEVESGEPAGSEWTTPGGEQMWAFGAVDVTPGDELRFVLSLK